MGPIIDPLIGDGSGATWKALLTTQPYVSANNRQGIKAKGCRSRNGLNMIHATLNHNGTKFIGVRLKWPLCETRANIHHGGDDAPDDLRTPGQLNIEIHCLISGI